MIKMCTDNLTPDIYSPRAKCGRLFAVYIYVYIYIWGIYVDQNSSLKNNKNNE